MSENGWRGRLRAAVEQDGRSMRRIGMAAGLSPGYLHSILSEGKDPSIAKLQALCNTMNVSTAYIIHGVDVTPEQLEILELIRSDPERVQALLALFGKKSPA